MPFNHTMCKHSMIDALNQDKISDLNEANNDFPTWKPVNDRCLLPHPNNKNDIRPALSPRIRIPVTRAQIECVAERDQLLQAEAEAAYREYAMYQRIQNARRQKSHYIPQSLVPAISRRGSDTPFYDQYCAWEEQTRLHYLTAYNQVVVTGGSHDEVVIPEEHEGVFEMEL
jgi:hypothetical protein